MMKENKMTFEIFKSTVFPSIQKTLQDKGCYVFCYPYKDYIVIVQDISKTPCSSDSTNLIRVTLNELHIPFIERDITGFSAIKAFDIDPKILKY